MRALLALFAALLAAQAVRADPPASVLVTTTMPHQGERPERIAAYGTARPAIDAATTVSQQLDGQVTAIAVTPGEVVDAGQKLLVFRPSAAAISLYRQAVTALATARSSRAHTAQLLAERLATRDQLAQADKAVSDASASLEALRREGGGERQVIVGAPFAGIVQTIPVAQGVRIAPGTPLLTLTARDGLVVTVGIDPSDRARVQRGDPVQLDRLAGGPSLAGRVQRIDGVLDPATRMVDVDVAVPADALLSGEAFVARITLRQVSGWLVPHDAIDSDQHGAWVFQVAGNHGVRVDVTVELAQGDADVVAGPIDPHRPLVVNGAYQLTDGTPVRSAPP